VDVFRDGTNRSTTLPTFFGNVFGITSQKIKATATAQVAAADGTDCLRPFAVPTCITTSRLDTPTNPTESTTTGKRRIRKGDPLAMPDVYIPPTLGLRRILELATRSPITTVKRSR
jgi:hypothetical protein